MNGHSNQNKQKTFEEDLELMNEADDTADGDNLTDDLENAKLAELVRFDDSPSVPSPVIPENEEIEQQNLLIQKSELFDDPIQGKTEPNFSKRGLSKAFATGSVLFIGFGAVGLFLNSVFNQPIRKAPVAVSPAPSPTPTTTPTPGTETGKLKTDLALGKQADQLKALNDAKSPRNRNNQVQPSRPQQSEKQPVVSSSPPPPPPSTVAAPYNPPPRNYPQPTSQPTPTRQRASQPTPTRQRAYREPQPPQRAYREPPQLPLRTSTPVASVPTRATSTPASAPKLQAEEKTVDPMQQWMALNRLGSYGNSDVGEKVPISAPTLRTAPTAQSKSASVAIAIPASVPVASSTDGAIASTRDVPIAIAAVPTPSVASVPQQEPFILRPPQSRANQSGVSSSQLRTPVTETGEAPQDTQGSSTLAPPVIQPPAAVQSVAQINPAEEANILNGIPVRRLTVGGVAQGHLVTPIIWTGQGQATKSPERPTAEKFIVQLAESLADGNGGVAMPAGTQLVATVVGVNESGLAQLSVTQVIVDSQEYVLPPGAISIRGNNGQPLIASKWGDKGPAIASGDATAFLFGSLSRVGQVLTQPNSESSTSVGGFGYSSTTSSRSGDRNVLGAILDGGFTPLVQQILKRNEQHLEEITSRPDVWYVRAGENVQVFVNRSFEL
ncbi:conjugal transfer protein TrbI [Microcoleus sp. FACHB-831]|uniref:TrbI/VirB10 family protein n=1 Tax=Microcoleus sp. FACHB-831 TaxID=2692827 RepID=UPI0016853482|nr:TrbI/VirB10 family protein [Microcoleus sp. FACHB-831]MBD1922593.1 conjugal transfer protein TrbI [Microcoleus sp. FACHB-831]